LLPEDNPTRQFGRPVQRVGFVAVEIGLQCGGDTSGFP
jgi:hypothetical protein